jgi:hypothetical protein
MSTTSTAFSFTAEATRIAEEANKVGINLRVLGATAFRIHCPGYEDVHIAMGRDLSDIDFVGYSKEERKMEEFLAGVLHLHNRQQAALTPGLFAGRHIYINQETGLHVDVFIDKLDMCHVIDFRNRLQVDSPTIPLAELVLEKMQIVTLNEKDVKDMLMLLAVHDVGDNDNDTINGKYIADLLSKDWGFYYTTTLSLEKVRNGIERYKDVLKPGDAERVAGRIGKLSAMIEAAPKSLKWKARAAIGSKVQWYNDVEEVDRADHLADL